MRVKFDDGNKTSVFHETGSLVEELAQTLCSHQAPVIQRVDGTFQWIKLITTHQTTQKYLEVVLIRRMVIQPLDHDIQLLNNSGLMDLKLGLTER